MQQPPTIIFEDEEFLVLNKPSGMTVNKADTTKAEVTVQEWAEKYVKVEKVEEVDKVENEENSTFATFSTSSTFFERGGIVHRLDKETSGILLVAKTPEAFIELQRQFKERIVKKTYVALAHGNIQPEVGEIAVPVGRLPWNRKQFGVVSGGREALTKYKTISNFKSPISNESMTFVELYPYTGRTHQIRVHLKHIGHPIFGDFLYAGRKTAREDRKHLARVFLHASKITFLHPKSGEELFFEAPLSLELEETLQKLNQEL